MNDPAAGGILCPVITPFQKDERIDYSVWQSLLERLVGAGIGGVFALGFEGEFYTLSEEERRVSIRFCAQTLAKRVPLYGNIGASTTRESIRLAQDSEADGLTAAVVITPLYSRPGPDELFDHFVGICRAVRIPVYAFSESDTAMSPSVVSRLAAVAENFAGVFHRTISGGEWSRTQVTAQETSIVAEWRKGVTQFLAASSNIAPAATVELLKACRGERWEDAARLQSLVTGLAALIDSSPRGPVLKWAMRASGLSGALPRRPAATPPAGSDEILQRALSELMAANLLEAPNRTTVPTTA